MGLFNSKNKIDNVELAYQLYCSVALLGFSVSPEYENAVNEIYNKCADDKLGYAKQKDLFLEAIRLTGNPDTPKQRYILAVCYSGLGAKYRQQAIEHLELYVKGPLWEEYYTKGRTGLSFYASSDNEAFEINRCSHLADMYTKLGAAYEGEYEFQKALQAYAESLKLLDTFAYSYLHIIEILRKMNRLDLALEVIENAKTNPQYHSSKPIAAPEYDFDNMNIDDIFNVQQQQWDSQLSNDFTNVINAKEQEIKDKIAKGYVYRPRKRKEK